MRAFEFLHATFAEFLVARLIARLAAFGRWSLADGGLDFVATLRSLLSFTALTDTSSLLPLLEGHFRSASDTARQSAMTRLTTMIGEALGWRADPVGAFPNRPQ